jgi:hypothetical protein
MASTHGAVHKVKIDAGSTPTCSSQLLGRVQRPTPPTSGQFERQSPTVDGRAALTRIVRGLTSRTGSGTRRVPSRRGRRSARGLAARRGEVTASSSRTRGSRPVAVAQPQSRKAATGGPEPPVVSDATAGHGVGKGGFVGSKAGHRAVGGLPASSGSRASRYPSPARVIDGDEVIAATVCADVNPRGPEVHVRAHCRRAEAKAASDWPRAPPRRRCGSSPSSGES